MSYTAINLGALVDDKRALQRKQLLDAPREDGGVFSTINGFHYLELVHLDTGSYVSMDLEPGQAHDRPFIEQCVKQMHGQLMEAIEKAQISE